MANADEFEYFTATEEQIKQSLNISVLKAPHINPHAPNNVKRDRHRIRTNIFHGAIAQFAVADILLQNIASKIEMYDLIRKDRFRRPDLWDLKAEILGRWQEVEVRSSYIEQKCLGLNITSDILSCIQKEYNLIARYTSTNKKRETLKPLVFHVYWTYPKDEAQEVYHNIEQGNSQNVACYVVGYATRTLVKSKGRKISLGQSGASYEGVAIADTYPCKRLGTLRYEQS